MKSCATLFTHCWLFGYVCSEGVVAGCTVVREASACVADGVCVPSVCRVSWVHSHHDVWLLLSSTVHHVCRSWM